ncbi:hypothetical protein CLOM_g7005 [Closterium sp. NIES-68]|nr:hypothetical protein CLOM_g7005 [Closterium sp. NIES-68]
MVGDEREEDGFVGLNDYEEPTIWRYVGGEEGGGAMGEGQIARGEPEGHKAEERGADGCDGDGYETEEDGFVGLGEYEEPTIWRYVGGEEGGGVLGTDGVAGNSWDESEDRGVVDQGGMARKVYRVGVGMGMAAQTDGGREADASGGMRWMDTRERGEEGGVRGPEPGPSRRKSWCAGGDGVVGKAAQRQMGKGGGVRGDEFGMLRRKSWCAGGGGGGDALDPISLSDESDGVVNGMVASPRGSGVREDSVPPARAAAPAAVPTATVAAATASAAAAATARAAAAAMATAAATPTATAAAAAPTAAAAAATARAAAARSSRRCGCTATSAAATRW